MKYYTKAFQKWLEASSRRGWISKYGNTKALFCAWQAGRRALRKQERENREANEGTWL